MDESEIIRRILAGQRQDFGQLVERYQKAVYFLACRFVREEDAADIVQATFLQAFTHLHQFRGQASFKTWLYRPGFTGLP